MYLSSAVFAMWAQICECQYSNWGQNVVRSTICASVFFV